MSQEEQTLVRLAKRGDTAAFEQLVTQHAQLVYNLALRTLNNPQEAEDITQEAFIRAWKALPKFRQEARFGTWLYRIVTNLCYNRLPKLKRELETLDPDEGLALSESGQAVEKGIISAELRQTLHAAVDQLPESYRLLITLRHLQGMSYQEIAAATNMPLGTVKTGIFRARRSLRESLETYER